MDKSLSNTIARFTFYFVAAVLLLWTASLTYTFVATALPGMAWYVPLLSLVVFDVGMIAWMFVFLHHAEGAGQRGIAILATALDLAGVGLMVLAEVLLGGQTLAAAPEQLGEYAIWGIAIWTVANVIAVVAYHLLSPEARQLMALQAEKDAIYTAALQQLRTKRQDQSGALANVLSDRMLADLVAGLVVDHEHQAPARAAVLTLPDAAAAEQRKQPVIMPLAANGKGPDSRPTPPAAGTS